jgi:hypothetical protein
MGAWPTDAQGFQKKLRGAWRTRLNGREKFASGHLPPRWLRDRSDPVWQGPNILDSWGGCGKIWLCLTLYLFVFYQTAPCRGAVWVLVGKPLTFWGEGSIVVGRRRLRVW